MAENIDRHRNSVMNLEYTMSQRLGNKWKISRLHSSVLTSHEETRAPWW
jgi:hypothetical protein